MRVDMLVTTRDGQVVAGSIYLVNGQFELEADPHYVTLMESMLEDPVVLGDKVIDSGKQPLQWMRALPSYYSGSYLRARLVK